MIIGSSLAFLMSDVLCDGILQDIIFDYWLLCESFPYCHLQTSAHEDLLATVAIPPPLTPRLCSWGVFSSKYEYIEFQLPESQKHQTKKRNILQNSQTCAPIYKSQAMGKAMPPTRSRGAARRCGAMCSWCFARPAFRGLGKRSSQRGHYRGQW